jgi:hypothetical protein
MGKAKLLGLEFNDAAWARYGALDPKHALDTIHESWSLRWLFPKHRDIDAGAWIANSVNIRCKGDSGYRPSNLTLVGGVPTGYHSVGVVAEPAET